MQPQKKQQLLDELYSRITSVLNNYHLLRDQVQHLAQQPIIEESTLELKEILKSDEKAVGGIVDAVTGIQEYCITLELSPEAMEELGNRFMQIYELSSFQDISGQRIKKVLGHLDQVRTKLDAMQATSHHFVRQNEYAAVDDQSVSLLNGPPLADDVPTQAEIDRIFASL